MKVPGRIRPGVPPDADRRGSRVRTAHLERGPDVGYGRSWTGRILKLERERAEPDEEPIWVASELDTARFARVFAGGRWQLFDPQPYEWQ
jgi:hypothetical protein